MPGLDEIVAKVATHYKVSPEELVTSRRGRGAGNFPRKVAMYVAQVRGQYRLTEIADYFGLSHYGGVSSAISAVKSEARRNKKVSREVKSIINRFDP